MKAWIVRAKDEFKCSVVFAENRGKAKSAALRTPAFDNVTYKEIEARRLPMADSQYRGKFEMDWENPDDRLFLVKEVGFRCEYIEPACCERCSAKEYCSCATHF